MVTGRVVPLEWSVGPILIGVFVNTYLFGVVSYQYAAYFTRKFNDLLWIRLTVMLLCITDVCYTSSILTIIWDYSITAAADPAVLTKQRWQLVFTPTFSAVAALLTHNFLGYRIYKLTDNKRFYQMIMVPALLCFVCGIISGFGPWELGYNIWMEVLCYIRLALQSVVDVIISGTLVYLYNRSRTGGSRMDPILKRLIRGAIQTGSFASAFAIAVLITISIFPTTKVWAAFAIPIGRLYSITLMDTLIVRPSLRNLLAQPMALGDLETIKTNPAEQWMERAPIMAAIPHNVDVTMKTSADSELSSCQDQSQGAIRHESITRDKASGFNV